MSILLTGVRLNKRGFMTAMIPYFPFFTWYYIFSYDILKFIIDKYTGTFFICNTLFNFFISLGLILGSSFIRRVKKTSIIYIWSILSSIGTMLIILVPNNILKLTIYLLSGVLYGIGLLAYFIYFWNLTVPEERGRIAGLIGFIFLPILSFIGVLVINLDFIGTAVLCIILNLGILGIIPFNPGKITILTAKRDLRGFNPEKRTILLYLIPWLIFSSINSTLAKAVSFHISLHISQYFSVSSLILLRILQVVGASLGAIIGGVVADFFGRRLSLAFGLTLYGISSAISGLAKSNEIFYLVFIANGLNWGILLTLYLFVIWGDLATIETSTRRYSIGLAIFYSIAGLGALFSPQLFQISLIVASITSCLLIFLSNIPLILAPELLPSDFREKIRLKLYLYLVRRRKRKYFSGQG